MLARALSSNLTLFGGGKAFPLAGAEVAGTPLLREPPATPQE